MKYEKIIKWVLAVLFVVGIVFSFYGFIVGFESNGNAPVDNILYCAYAFAAVTILAVLFGVVVIGGMKVALITTVGGLIVAVILQIFYNYILSQVESLTIDMEDASISHMDILG